MKRENRLTGYKTIIRVTYNLCSLKKNAVTRGINFLMPSRKSSTSSLTPFSTSSFNSQYVQKLFPPMCTLGKSTDGNLKIQVRGIQRAFKTSHPYVASRRQPGEARNCPAVGRFLLSPCPPSILNRLFRFFEVSRQLATLMLSPQEKQSIKFPPSWCQNMNVTTTDYFGLE